MKTIEINGRVYYAIVFLFGMIMLAGLSSAQLIGKYQTTYDVKRPCINNGTYCSASSTCNITINYPDGTLLVANSPMTYQTSYFNYTISNTSLNQLGTYECLMTCKDGSLSGSDTFSFDVTGNGKPEPSGIVIVLFSVIAIAIFGVLIYLIFYSIGHIVSLDFDLVDMAINWGAVFAFYAMFILEGQYLGNPTLNSLFDIVVSVIVWTNGALALLGFVLTITAGTLVRNKHERGDYNNG